MEEQNQDPKDPTEPTKDPAEENENYRAELDELRAQLRESTERTARIEEELKESKATLSAILNGQTPQNDTMAQINKLIRR